MPPGVLGINRRAPCRLPGMLTQGLLFPRAEGVAPRSPGRRSPSAFFLAGHAVVLEQNKATAFPAWAIEAGVPGQGLLLPKAQPLVPRAAARLVQFYGACAVVLPCRAAGLQRPRPRSCVSPAPWRFKPAYRAVGRNATASRGVVVKINKNCLSNFFMKRRTY
jgi:hypothetical protein